MELLDYLKKIGIINPKNVFYNLSVGDLVEHSVSKNEGVLSDTGAISITTGVYTGRSPEDRFIVDTEDVHDLIYWGKVNKPISVDVFNRVYGRLMAYLENRDLYVFDGYAGADERFGIKVRFINEMAVQNLFVHQLFIRKDDLKDFEPDFTVIAAPHFKAIPEVDGTNSEAFVIINFEKRVVIIGGTMYCGEIKKSVFSVMNYLLPQRNVLPMHCSANVGKDGDVALFFGLSGTGKTTLSADGNRYLIGDDEHGWSTEGVFNFEGGCYAKCIGLDKDKEPQIYNAIKFGTVLENVVLNENRVPDYNDSSLTENTRAGYPIDYIDNALKSGKGGHPKTIIFLTADAFGVLPPISKLTKEQAMYHFMSGYTSKLAGTERGIKEPKATFSACFGEPFMPLSPLKYAKMLGEKIEKYDVRVFLVNTGWSGGPYGVGNRINLKYTRRMVEAAINGELDNVEYVVHPIFKLNMPSYIDGVPEEILNPINTWKDKDEYIRYAKELEERFRENFKRFQREEEDKVEKELWA
ncbi:phosphoenolpyruvate carboxykinase (ATP) [Caloramator proteoclasticus]|uniref:Phosphoenolpyruvate carboxykinase (ATP) n=1 Tax=Caloramator proteoclasticus DSM 10124 TaxID=1121262 RepID=A0A1M4UBR3_9CLOT|nr:phosphoenolpyruvate carboxykinase (ATP) [Caloramator proteoclasticus]SHE54003.1 phosphoenolpyruvate carboxykinase (ATP) [Caloramator proteoclasticus DSM 10124]